MSNPVYFYLLCCLHVYTSYLLYDNKKRVELRVCTNEVWNANNNMQNTVKGCLLLSAVSLLICIFATVGLVYVCCNFCVFLHVHRFVHARGTCDYTLIYFMIRVKFAILILNGIVLRVCVCVWVFV